MNPIRHFLSAAVTAAAFVAWTCAASAQGVDPNASSEMSNITFPSVSGETISLSPEGKSAMRKVEDRQIKELRDLEDKYYSDLRALREKQYRERMDVKKQHTR